MTDRQRLLPPALRRPSRVLLAGHLDTVPVAGNLPSRRENDVLHGCGTADMKSGDAVFLHLAATVAEPVHDLTLVLYDCEEIDSAANGLPPAAPTVVSLNFKS